MDTRQLNFNSLLPLLSQAPPQEWPEIFAPCLRLLGPNALRARLANIALPEEGILEISKTESTLNSLGSLDPASWRREFVSSTNTASLILDVLRDNTSYSQNLAAAFPELAYLAEGRSQSASHEHESRQSLAPLLDHTTRVLRRLAVLETNSQKPIDLLAKNSTAVLNGWKESLVSLETRNWLPLLRLTLTHLDISKGGSEMRRRLWLKAGHDLTLHNDASATILTKNKTLTRYQFSAGQSDLIVSLIRVHGLVGQAVRGETPLIILAPLVRELAQAARKIAGESNQPLARILERVIDIWHLINILDTSAVREGLMTDVLAKRFSLLMSLLAPILTEAANSGLANLAESLDTATQSFWAPNGQELDTLINRLGHLRTPVATAQVRLLIDELPISAQHYFLDLVKQTSFWYAESASGMLSPANQLKLLALGLVAAAHTKSPRHLTLEPLVSLLRGEHTSVPYRVRLIEATLASLSLSDILSGHYTLPEDAPLRVRRQELGPTQAVAITLEESEEAHALLTLLAIYEKKGQASYHTILKALCDLYNLRTDDFDRVANEPAYFANMNSASDDKAKMLPYIVPGTIIEVGPGGGVVLDLLSHNFPGSHIIGIDTSAQVIKSLDEKQAKFNATWQLKHGDAFELPEIFGPNSTDSIIFCSVLHEIYSYHHLNGKVFQLDSVKYMIQAAYGALRPGGRIIIRDGVKPEAKRYWLNLHSESIRLALKEFQQYFKGRPLSFVWLNDYSVACNSEDAMEFLYTYIWGPQSFPYEVREQYGVFTYSEYEQALLTWTKDAALPGRLVALPGPIQSYLQPGYQERLAPEVSLSYPNGEAAPFFDSNALWVLEKPLT